MVEAALRGEAHERREQVLAQRAADAAVGELDHLLLLLKHAAAPHQLSVDVDRGHVVDHNGNAGYSKVRRLQKVQTLSVATSWNPQQEVVVHIVR